MEEVKERVPEPFVEEFLDHINRDYMKWVDGFKAKAKAEDSEGVRAMPEEFTLGLQYEKGHKYIKIVENRIDGTPSVHSFIVNTANDGKFRLGDILKPISFLAPNRKESVGNVIEGDYKDRVRWIGAN